MYHGWIFLISYRLSFVGPDLLPTAAVLSGDVESTKYLENRHATLFIKLNSQFILVNDCLHPRILQAGLARLVSRVLFKPVQLRNVSASKDSMRRNDRRVNYM